MSRRRGRHPPRGPSPLERLRRAKTFPPEAGHIELDGPGASADLSVVFCPILKWDGGAPYCNRVDCGRCPVLRRFLDEEVPEFLWLCTVCSSELRVLPYWTDGSCEDCGLELSALVLAVPFPTRRSHDQP